MLNKDRLPLLINQKKMALDLTILLPVPVLFKDTIHSANSFKLAYSICTPLGSPVDPEVKLYILHRFASFDYQRQLDIGNPEYR